jgi:hypothetical protein
MDPGMCVYEMDGAPSCVIAHLAALEGVPAEMLAQWDEPEGRADTTISSVLEHRYDEDTFPLKDYPIEVLEELQSIYDAGTVGNVDDTRDELRAYMESVQELFS